jgi:protein arginine kinase activator
MKCEACEKAPATVHLTEIVNKKKRELHLCEDCAREKGVSVKATFGEPEKPSPLKEAAAISGAIEKHAIEKAQAGALARVDDLSNTACPVCGLSFAEFRASGRLGCANDYMAFKKGLVPLLEKIHGKVEHHGKVPAHIGERIERQRKVAELRQKLNAAIQREEYEKAAELRDEIYKLEEPAK